MKIYDNDHILMGDGTRYYANSVDDGGPVLGLTPEGVIYCGADGCPDDHTKPHGHKMPTEHRREIAVYMAALWTKVALGEL